MRVPAVAACLALVCGCAPEPAVAPSAPQADLTPRRIDTLEDGFALADQWAAAGHPFTTWVRSSQEAQFARTLCPKHVDPHGDPQGCPRRGRRRDYDWYVHALDERPAFARALLQRGDPLLTEIAIVNIDEHWGDAAALLMARALDADHRLWQAALEVIAAEVDADGSPSERALPVAHEAWRHGQAHPEARGDVLYVLALAGYADHGDRERRGVPWERFPEWFGSTMTGDDFRVYLDHGRRAEEMIARVCPALGSGWSLASLLLPRIRLELASDVDRWRPALATSAEDCLCDRRDVDGLAALAETLRAVAAEHPGWQYGDLVQRFTEDRRRCKVRPSSQPPAAAPSPETPVSPAPASPQADPPVSPGLGTEAAATERLFRDAHEPRGDTWSVPPEAMAGLWKRLASEEAWQAAARVIVEDYFPILRLDRDGFAPFVHAAEAQWVHHASRRGPLLYLLARAYQLQHGEALDDSGNTKTFREHMVSFGAPFDRGLFDAALDASPFALRVAPLLAQAVEGEVPLVDDSLARLDRYLDAEAASAQARTTRPRVVDEAAARSTMDALSALTCDRGRARELAQLRATLAARLARHEEEDAAFGYLAAESTPTLCRTSEGARASRAGRTARNLLRSSRGERRGQLAISSLCGGRGDRHRPGRRVGERSGAACLCGYCGRRARAPGVGDSAGYTRCGRARASLAAQRGRAVRARGRDSRGAWAADARASRRRRPGGGCSERGDVRAAHGPPGRRPRPLARWARARPSNHRGAPRGS